MPFLKRINLYQNKPKIKSVLQKIKIFRELGALAPRPPTHSPSPLQISGSTLDTTRVLLTLSDFKILQREVIELAK